MIEGDRKDKLVEETNLLSRSKERPKRVESVKEVIDGMMTKKEIYVEELANKENTNPNIMKEGVFNQKNVATNEKVAVGELEKQTTKGRAIVSYRDMLLGFNGEHFMDNETDKIQSVDEDDEA